MEKKRSSRPTWAQVKELEKVIAELKAMYDAQQSALKRHEAVVEESADMSKELSELRKKQRKQADMISLLSAERDQWKQRYDAVMRRGLWARILNRKE